MRADRDLNLEETFTVEHLSAMLRIDEVGAGADILGIYDYRMIDLVHFYSANATLGSFLKPPPEPPPPMFTFWTNYKKEFKSFVCTKSRKYQRLRTEIAKQGRKSQTVLVGAIAAAIGASLGVIPGVITPLVLLSLIALLKMGKEAYCKEVHVDDLRPLA